MIFGILFSVGLAMGAYAESSDSPMGHMMHHNMTQPINDDRISLGLSPEMAQHQLANMRSHVEAVQSIVGLLVEGAFDKASQIAHSKLGLTDKMKNDSAATSGLFLNILSQKRLAYAAAIPFAATVLRT